MTQNPNWPVIMEDWGPYWNVNAGDSPLDRYVEFTSRVIGPTSVKRGRQYELDQIQAGEYNTVLSNLDGTLDPLNASGPWYGNVRPYSPYRKRAQWPPTQNLLTQVQAAGGYGYAAGSIPSGAEGVDVFSQTDSSGGSIVNSATAYYGSNVLQFSVPSGTANGSQVCYTMQPGVVPGQAYTEQIQVRNVTPSTSLVIQVFIGWYVVGGGNPTLTGGQSSTLVGSSTAGWTQLTVTATAPANAAGMALGIACGPASATSSIQVSGWQLEKGSTASPWTLPGVWYPLYAGFVERWPSSWELEGTYGQVKPVAVDAFGLLSQVTLTDPLTQEINSRNPRFLYTLGDPQGVNAVADQTGNYPAAPIAAGKYGPGSVTTGNQITSASSGGTYIGSSGSVATVNNSNPGTNILAAASFISLGSAGISGPINPGKFTRMIAFRYTGPTPTSGAYLWSCMDHQRSGGQPSGSLCHVYINTSGSLTLWMQGPSGAGATWAFGGTSNVVDGNWHLALFGFDSSAGSVMASLDGTDVAFYSAPSSYSPTGLRADNVGNYVDITTGGATFLNWQGDISFVAEFPKLFGSSDIFAVYGAWKSAFSGESSDARYARILRYAGYNGGVNIPSGMTTSMGPATNLAGTDALSALEDVITTENGAHFVSRDGTVTFQPRSARYNATTPTYVFGENVANGEFPYEECQLDFDPTHLANQVTVTQEGTNQAFYSQDATSIANFMPRTLTRSNNASSGVEVQSAADYLLARYKNPAVRVKTIKLHPSANNSLWPVCLNLELGMRVRVMRRPFGGAPPIQVDCFVEQVQVDMDDKGEAFWTLQCSPADLTPYGLFAAWHTTLNASIASNVSSFVVKAPTNNTTPLWGQIGQGQQLVLGQGTANQETVTVLSATSTGSPWTTGTITLQSPTTKSHTANDVVCEPLPSGTTDPTTWDVVSEFDSVAFAY